MFWNILRMENEKTFKRPFFWISLIVLVVLVAFFYSMFFAFRGNIPPSGTQFLYWPRGLIYALGYAAGYASWTSYGTYFLMILVGVLTAREYSWRTLQQWLSHGVPRPLLLAAKFVLSLVTALLIALVCLLVIGGLSALFSVLVQGTVHTQDVDYAQLVLSFLRTAYAMLPYAALTFLLAVISRSTVIAVGGGLAFMAVIETTLINVLPLFGQNFARIVQYLPSGLASALNSQNFAIAREAATQNALQPSPMAATIGIAIYTVVFCGVALWVFQHQDLTN
jgi:ABC-type transport system involved in multi-copper enzyme maturation permease subunit